MVATTIGYLTGMLNSFVLNRKWTFDLNGKGRITEIVKFFVVNAIAMIVNAIVLKATINYFSMLPEVAQIIAISGSMVINFSGNKWWTFEEAA